MRKRIVIACVAVVVIGVLAVWLSQPKKGSVEYHKSAYLRAIPGPGKWLGFAPRVVQQAWSARRTERLAFHWEALQENGYLRDSGFVVSNVAPSDVAQTVLDRVSGLGSKHSHFVWVSDTDSNVVVITAPMAVMKQLEEWVRAADVPESGK
jgi:hypothetical protein